MTINNGLQNKDEQTLDKSDNSSVHSETPARIEDIFEWIDGIPLSKTTKNLARDFSDAVLMSEILKYYYPNLVKTRNYIPANNVISKKENWNTLNRKVLSKIDLRLSLETIDQLSHSQIGVIDKVLMDFREKQMSVKLKEKELQSSEINPTDLKSSTVKQVDVPPTKNSNLIRIYQAFKKFFGALFGFLLTITCFWKWFSRKPKSESTLNKSTTNTTTVKEQEDEKFKATTNAHPQEQGDQARVLIENKQLQKLRAKSESIDTLYHKVAFLESAMKLKDLKIATLTNKIEHNASEIMTTFASRPNIPLAMSNMKITRRRPRTQI